MGARPPYLNSDVQYREVLWEAGFLYDRWAWEARCRV